MLNGGTRSTESYNVTLQSKVTESGSTEEAEAKTRDLLDLEGRFGSFGFFH